jgi:organic radical activating enzyme
LDFALLKALHTLEFVVAVETNGTRIPPNGVDWLCVSPKGKAELLLQTGQELKLVYPQPGVRPEDFVNLNFQHFFLQPMDGPDLKTNTQSAIDYCLANPKWRLSLQLHKIVGIP